jgi:transcriptional regulator with XRE-family HTH domain
MFGTDTRQVARHDTKMPSRKPFYHHVYLKEWREAHGLSGPELGEKMGRDKFYISRIETKKQSVDKEERDLLGEALGIPGDALLAPPSNEVLASAAQTRRSAGDKEAVPVRNLRPLAKRLIKKFGEPFIDAVLDEAAEPKGPPPRPRRRPKE